MVNENKSWNDPNIVACPESNQINWIDMEQGWLNGLFKSSCLGKKLQIQSNHGAV